MEPRESLVAQLLLKSAYKSKDMTVTDENVNDLTTANDDVAIDLTQPTKEQKNQSMKLQESTEIDFIDQNPKQETSNVSDERQFSHDGVFKCTLCPFLADSARVLFKHYNFHKHHDQTSNYSLKENSSIVGENSSKCQAIYIMDTAPEVCSTSETMEPKRQSDSPSLRELLQKKEVHSTPASKYLKSIVKAVINENSNDISSSFNTDNYNQNYSTLEEQSSCGNHISPQPLSISTSDQYASVLTSHASSSPIAIKDEPEWIHEAENYVHPQNDRKDTSVFAPIPIEGYFTCDQLEGAHQRPNKRKCKPTRLQERQLLTGDEYLSKHRKLRQNPTPILPKVIFHGDGNIKKSTIPGVLGLNVKDKAVQCEIITPNMDKISSTVDYKSEVTSAIEECSRVSSSMNQHTCEHCGIHFSDEVLYSIHMGCHSLGGPFNCNICGKNCKDKYGFYIHIMRGHQYN